MRDGPTRWADRESDGASAAGSGVAYLAAHASHLWVVAIVFFGVGDLVTTGVGLSIQGTVEAGPVGGAAYREFGLVVVPLLKAVSIGLPYLVWKHTPAPYRVGIPLGLAVFGVLVTLWNGWVLLVALEAAPPIGWLFGR